MWLKRPDTPLCHAWGVAGFLVFSTMLEQTYLSASGTLPGEVAEEWEDYLLEEAGALYSS